MTKACFKKCYLSELGHKNFWYPTDSQALLSSDCETQVLPWLHGSGRKLKALKVLKRCVLPLSYSVTAGEVFSPAPPDTHVVVWVEE